MTRSSRPADLPQHVAFIHSRCWRCCSCSFTGLIGLPRRTAKRRARANCSGDRIVQDEGDDRGNGHRPDIAQHSADEPSVTDGDLEYGAGNHRTLDVSHAHMPARVGEGRPDEPPVLYNTSCTVRSVDPYNGQARGFNPWRRDQSAGLRKMLERLPEPQEQHPGPDFPGPASSRFSQRRSIRLPRLRRHRRRTEQQPLPQPLFRR